MSRPVVGVDIDDVLYPWYDTAHRICVREGLTLGDVIPSTWSPHLEYGVELEDWIKILGVATLSGELYYAPPIPGTIQALHQLRGIRAEIHLITARGYMQHGDEIKLLTREWLDDWMVPYDGLVFTKDKSTVAKKLGVTHFIDDNVGNVSNMLAEHPTCRTYLQDRPWNQGTDYPVTRIDHISELVLDIMEGN